MSIEVLGAGFGRTGTVSIKLALETLGFGPCHHMEQVFTDENQLRVWRRVLDGESADWDKALEGFRAAIDWPSTHFWRELADHYPDAKVLLSVRPVEQWWDSLSQTIKQLIDRRDEVPSEHRREVLAFAHEMIEMREFGGAMDDKDNVIETFNRRVAEVTATVPEDRLLVYEVTSGWQPLCDFLGVPVPDTAFPRSNDEDEFWQFFGQGLT